ncbi:MAG: TrkH family potassium uptake protein, partial [Xanthomonadales bacterium]|nr:TrkH family potassium uptake protein [Xanthomonadales bacterium]
GALLMLASLFPVPPLALAVVLGESTVVAFAGTFLITSVLGLVLWWPVRRVRHPLRLRDGFLITTAAWTVASLVASLPFMLASPALSFTHAVFESVSGLSTTGATSISGIDGLPRSMLLYRQSLNFYGGMGIVLLAVAIMPMLRVGGMQLFRAEATGPTKDTKLTPRIAETAKALWKVYLGLNILCALAFWAAGMSLFDAVCHALSTVSTAGFSTHDASFGYWDSPMIEMVATCFMLVGGINFGLHYVAWRRATTAAYLRDTELRFFLLVAVVVTVIVTVVLWLSGEYSSLLQALRFASFQTVANLTTTGYTSDDFSLWPSFVPLLLILVAFVGGSSGSTSGGMKVARVTMAVRQSLREVKQLVHPKGQFIVKMAGRRVPEHIVLAVSGFCTLYVLCFALVTVALTMTGVDIITAFAAAASSINNLGPGLGEISVHFGTMPAPAVWICSFAMMLGRLEVFPVLVLFTPMFWRE